MININGRKASPFFCQKIKKKNVADTSKVIVKKLT
jgi:hypothetical protein